MCTAICLDPRKPSVIERFSLLGEFVIRGSAVYVYIRREFYKRWSYNRTYTVHTYVL